MISAGLLLLATVVASPVDKAFERLYNFDFAGAHSILDEHLKNSPADGLGYAVRASAFLFEELHRLRILESEFFAKDKRIIEKKKLVPDERIKASFDSALQTAEREAHANLAEPGQMMPMPCSRCHSCSGLRADYTAFIEKRQFQSLTSIRQSQMWSFDC